MQPGDVFEVEIDGIAVLSNPIQDGWEERRARGSLSCVRVFWCARLRQCSHQSDGHSRFHVPQSAYLSAASHRSSYTGDSLEPFLVLRQQLAE